MTDLSKAGRQELIRGVYQGFRNAGLSHEASMVMVGEVGRENAYEPRYLFGTHSDPHNKVTNTGLISWQGDRKVALERELTSKGLMQGGKMIASQETLNAQASFLVNEMKTQNPDVYGYLQSGQVDPDKGMDLVGKKFIRWRIDDPKYRAQGLRNRQHFYNQGLSAIGGSESPLATAPTDTSYSSENYSASVSQQGNMPGLFSATSGQEAVDIAKRSDFDYVDLLEQAANSPVQTYDLTQNVDPMDVIEGNYEQALEMKNRQDRITSRSLINAQKDLDNTNYWLNTPVSQGISGLSNGRMTVDQARRERDSSLSSAIYAERNAGVVSSFNLGVQSAMSPYFHAWERLTQESNDPGFTQSKREELYKKMVTDQSVNVGTMENWGELMSANSERQFMRRLSAIKMESEDALVVNASGTSGQVANFFGSMVDPVMVVPGIGLEKLAWNTVRAGTRIAGLSKVAKAAAEAGDAAAAGSAIAKATSLASPARQIGEAAAVGVAGNVVAQAGLFALDDTQSGTFTDYMLSAAMGAALGGGSRAWSVYRHSDSFVDPEVRKSMDETMAMIRKNSEVNDTLKAKWNEEAVAELGENATPSSLQARVTQKETEFRQKPLEFILAAVPQHMRAPGSNGKTLKAYLEAERNIDSYLSNARKEHDAAISQANKTVGTLKQERAKLEQALRRLSTTGDILPSLEKRTKGLENESLIPEADRPATPELPDHFDGFVPSETTANRVSRAMSQIGQEVDLPNSMRSRVRFVSTDQERFADIAMSYAWANSKGDAKKGQKRVRKAIEEYLGNSKLDPSVVESYGKQLLDSGDGKWTGRQTNQDVALREIEKSQQALASIHGKNALGEYQTYIKQVRGIRAGMGASERLDEIDELLAKADQDITAQEQMMKDLEGQRAEMLMSERDSLVGSSSAADNARAAARKDVWDEAIVNEKGLPKLDGRLKKVMQVESKAGRFSSHSTVTQTSENPIIRNLGYIMGESPYGIHKGRNAATVKYIVQRMLRGDVENQIKTTIDTVLKRHGNNPVRRFVDKTKREAIYSEFFRYMENRRNGVDNSNFPDGDLYGRLAENVEKHTQMMLDMGRHVGLEGYDLMPDKSTGWLPFVIDPKKFREVIGNSRENKDAFTQAMYESLMEGDMFEPSDRAKVMSIARQYVDIMTSKSLDKNFIASSPFSRTGANQVELAIKASNDLTSLEKEYYVKKFQSGGRETMRRLERDVNKSFFHPETGQQMRLSDVMVKDPAMLLNGHINRLSGELALQQFGLNSSLVDLMLEASADPIKGHKPATEREIRAIREMFHEYMGETAPGGNMPTGMQNWATLTRVVRLGGLPFAQMAELSVVMLRSGLGKTLKFFPEASRLISEAKANARGALGSDGVLGDLDSLTNGALGTDYFRHTGSHWSLSADVPAYRDFDVSLIGRGLSAMENFQGRMTFFHHLISAQQRFAAEGIANDLVSFLRGSASNRQKRSLQSAGFSDDLLERLKADSANVMEMMDNGQYRLTLGKMTNQADGADVIANIERGMNQVIQDRMIGEGGSWQHSWAWRFALQFRNYSILAMTKQTGRIYANEGAMALAGALVGAMSVVVPVQILRALAATVGMSEEDREKALAKSLDPGALLYQSMGYLSQAGIAPELLDVSAGFVGADFSNARFDSRGQVLGRITPGAGLFEQIVTGVAQHDPEKIARAAPFSSAIPVRQVLNFLASGMKDD